MKRSAIYVLLTVCLEASAQVTPAPGDQIETLVFTGTATCVAQPGVANARATCSGSAPVTGTYSLDLTTKSIVGPWSFSTPFGGVDGLIAAPVISSNQTTSPFYGCISNSHSFGPSNVSGSINVQFGTQSVIEYPCTVVQEFNINFLFPGADTEETGALASGYACYFSGSNGYSTCDLYYSITGTTALASASLQVTTTLPTATSSQTYSTTLAAIYGSGAGYAWSLSSGSLPAGFTLSPDGVLSSSGVPPATPGTYTFTVQVKDSTGNQASGTITLVVVDDGIITTVAGTGPSCVIASTNCVPAFSGDLGPAPLAGLSDPRGVAVDGAGNLYIVDSGNARVRKISPSGVITTAAGNGETCYPASSSPPTPCYLSADGLPATSAVLSPSAIAVDGTGNLYIADAFLSRIRMVSVATGIITTIAGNGASGFSGDGGPATAAGFYSPQGIAVDAAGNVFVSDISRIRKISASTGIISTVVGSATSGFSGDGGPALSGTLSGPKGIAVDAAGNLFIADTGNHRIRKVDTSGIITTVAGTGVACTISGSCTNSVIGDGGAATSASLNFPPSVAVDAFGNLYIADIYNNRIRKVSSTTGTITTIAGTGNATFAYGYGFSGDGGPAIAAALSLPSSVVVDALGNVFIADSYNNRIREVFIPGSGFTISSLNPGVASVGGTAINLTVDGAGFEKGATIEWNGAAVATTYISSNQLSASIASGSIAAPGNVAVTVLNSDGATSNPVTFTVNPAAPVISGLSPISAIAGGAAFNLTVSGSGFTSSSTVEWNGNSVATNFIAANQLSASIPASLFGSVGNVSVVVLDGVAGTSNNVMFGVAGPGQTVVITTYSVPSGGGGGVITPGPDGALWFTEPSSNRIGRVTTDGIVTEYTVPTPNSSPTGISGPAAIAVGPDGALWFPEYLGSKIGRITTSGVITEYPLPHPTSYPDGIVAGPDGALWFTEFLSTSFQGAIGRISTAGQVTNEYPITTTVFDNGTRPQTIISGSDGALWFTTGGNEAPQIGRITTSGVMTDDSWQGAGGVPANGSFCCITSSGPDGELWFTEDIVNRIGRLTTNGTVKEYQLPSTLNGGRINWEPEGIVTGPDGALWFTEVAGDKLGRITTAGVITEYDAPKSGGGITVGPDGALWYLAGDIIVRAAVSIPPAPAVISSFNPSTAIAGTSAFSLIVNGSGFVGGATVQWNGSAVTSSFVSPTQLTASIPASLIVSPGTVSITVLNPGTSSSNALTFTINPPPPAISALSPSAVTAGGQAFTLSVIGSNFTNGSTVNWNGVAAATGFVSATQLTASIPASLIATPISVIITVIDKVAGTSNAFIFAVGVAPGAPNGQLISHIADGGGWRSILLLANTGAVAAPYTVSFWNDSGLPYLPSLASGVPTGTIPVGGSTIIGTADVASTLSEGWAQVSSSQSIGGTAIFRYDPWSQEAAVPLLTTGGTKLEIPYQVGNGLALGVALANTNATQTANVTEVIRDQNGNQLSSRTLTLAPLNHTAFNPAFPNNTTAGGVVEYDANVNLFGLGIRSAPQDSGLAFTSVDAVLPQAASTKTISHIADGGGWWTSIIIVNTDAVPAQYTVNFWTDAGASYAPPLALGASTGTIPAGGSTIIETADTASTLSEGWAQVTSTQSVGGTAIFRYDPWNQEAAVPLLTSGGTKLEIPYQVGNGLSLGVALANPSAAQAANITEVIRDQNGNQLSSRTLTLAPQNHTAFNPAFPANTTGGGVVEYDSNTPLYGLGIRSAPEGSGLAFTSVRAVYK
jgi:streptogramin lyase